MAVTATRSPCPAIICWASAASWLSEGVVLLQTRPGERMVSSLLFHLNFNVATVPKIPISSPILSSDYFLSQKHHRFMQTFAQSQNDLQSHKISRERETKKTCYGPKIYIDPVCCRFRVCCLSSVKVCSGTMSFKNRYQVREFNWVSFDFNVSYSSC